MNLIVVVFFVFGHLRSLKVIKRLLRPQDEATVQAASLRQQVTELQGSQEQSTGQLLQLQSSVKQLEQGMSLRQPAGIICGDF